MRAEQKKPTVPTEDDLIRLTVDRIKSVASDLGTTPQMLCRRIVRDNRIWTRLIDRDSAVTARGKPQSITLSTYGQIHRELALLERGLRGARAR